MKNKQTRSERVRRALFFIKINFLSRYMKQ